MEHATDCLKRVIRLLLGQSSVKEAKCAFGNELEMLGVWLKPDISGIHCWPASAKVRANCVCARLCVQRMTCIVTCRQENGCMS